MIPSNGFTYEEASAILTAPTQDIEFHLDLLSNTGMRLRSLDSEYLSESGRLENDTKRDVIRSIDFTLLKSSRYVFDEYSHRIASYVWLRAKRNGADGTPYLKYRTGTYFISGFRNPISSTGTSYFEVSCDDYNFLLDIAMENDFYIQPQSSYRTAIIALLTMAGITDYYVSPTLAVTPVGRSFARGEKFSRVLKDLCGALNYVYYVDEYGKFIVQSWVNPAVQAPVWSYIPNARSVKYIESERVSDGLKVPNVVIGVASRPDAGTSFSAKAENNNLNSKFSIPRRGIRIPSFLTLLDTPDQPTFQQQVERKLLELSRTSSEDTMVTQIMPFHGAMDIVSCRTEDLALMIGEFDSTVEGWTHTNTSTPSVQDGFIRMTSTSSSPAIYKAVADMGLGFPVIDGTVYRYVKVSIRSFGGGQLSGGVYFQTVQHGSTSSDRFVSFSYIANGDYGGFQEFLIDMWTCPKPEQWKAEGVSQITVALANQSGRKIDVSYIRVWRESNKFTQNKFSYQFIAGGEMTHSLQLITPIN